MFSQACVVPSGQGGGEGSARGGGMHPDGLGRSPQSDTMGYGQRAGGTNPTGMYSC